MAQADLRTSGTPAHRSAAGRWPASMSSRCSESFGSEAGEESATEGAGTASRRWALEVEALERLGLHLPPCRELF